MENNNTVDSIATSKPGLLTDINDSLVGKDKYFYARNVSRNSKMGDLGTLSNEASNLFCYQAPYKIWGTVSLPDDTHLVFSGDGINSEIGLANEQTCSYTTLKNMPCLNFRAPVTGVAKKDFQKGVVATFTDKINPVRRIELKKLAGVTSCDDILLFKKIDHPCIEISKAPSGNMPNGTYSVAIAYNIDGKIFSDWYSITNRIQLHSISGNNAIDIEISNLDTEFKNYSLAVIANYIDPTTKGATKLAKIIGSYSTKTKKVSVTDFVNSNYQDIKLSDLVIRKTSWQKAGIISSNANYLMLGDLVSREEENYQPKTLKIKAEYVVEQVPVDYYELEGLDVGYYRDENYDFYIEGIYNTGESTDKFHIPGRSKKAEDSQLVASEDVFEYNMPDCPEDRKLERWQVENTAGPMIPYNNKFSCGRRVLGRGDMGYFESTERYPDNTIFGSLANKPIQFHKMPDECKVPRYEIIGNKTYINIIGVRFKDIPKFDSPDIVGYKITRSDRKGGNGTVIARGLMTNVRSYIDKQLDQEVLFSNYPVNDLRPDSFLSSTQTSFSNGSEKHFTPLTSYYKDKFSFYSPHTMFEPRYSLGNELKIECEEIADVKGKFELVHNHPKLVLLNQFAFWTSLAIGFIETYYESQGLKGSVKTASSGGVSGTAIATGTQGFSLDFDPDGIGPGGVKTSSGSTSLGNQSALAITGQGVTQSLAALVADIRKGNFAQLATYVKILKDAIKLIVSLGATAAMIAVSTMRYANEILDIIYKFTGNTDYVYQYNCHANFNESKCTSPGNKRRGLLRKPFYIPSDVTSVDDKLFNNYFREKTVLLELNKEIDDPTNKDTSRKTISEFGLCNNLNKTTESKGSAFYVTSKIANPNQYGAIGSSFPVGMHSCTISDYSQSSILYGGDCIITRFQFQKKMQFFNQNLANANFPDRIEYDYRLYRNIAYPRFWLDTTKYDFSELLHKKMVNFTTFSRTTAGKHNLDCKKSNDGGSIARIDDAYMYLSNNSVMDFIVEADFNPNFREKTKKPFYSKENTNLSLIFRSDNLETPEEFNINRVYTDIYTTEVYNQQQRDDFNPLDPLPVNQPNSVIYSSPSFNMQNADNWQYFLPGNYFAFRESDFGELTGIHKLDQDRQIFLFTKSSPFISMGKDFLELENSGRKITIGDGGLFAQDPREVMPTDNNYGGTTSRYAFSNTHMGKFYPSPVQGRILEADGLKDISRSGISYWCKNYMPINLYKYFPSYPRTENPVSGVGYLACFDSFTEMVYITKRDFSPKFSEITYNGKFTYKGLEVDLRDSKYFNDISWTLSYSPGDEAFVGWHDWHPDGVIQTENHFMTIKGNSVWKHGERFDSFCNFYGIDQPFSIGYLSSSGKNVEIARSIEYLLEVYKYKNSGRNRFHVLNENFDRLQVSNSEQASPLLNLVHSNPNAEENLRYPARASNSWDIAFTKVEQKYRINQFWDSVKDRGEFSNAEIHLYATDESGYKEIINPQAINLDKPEEQRKKFRHYYTKFLLTKTVSGPHNFICKLLDINKALSIR